MFGYIRIYKDELKFREFSLYRHHYCELCRNMGSYSNISRFFLSYDVTFFLMLGEPESPTHNSCQKCNVVTCRSKKSDGIYDFFAAFSIILIYHKLDNDVIDGDVKKRFSKMMIKRAYKKAISKYPHISEPIEQGIKEIVEREKIGETDYVEMSEKFAKCVSSACTDFFAAKPDCEIRLKIMENIVKCVYLLDIIDDVDKDYKHHDYNPLNIISHGLAGKDKILDVAAVITENLSIANSLLMLLPYSDCISIVGNILSLGLPFVLNGIIDKYKQ